MSIEEMNKAARQQWVERINARDFEGAFQLLGPEFVSQGRLTSVDEVRQLFEMRFAGFPDMHTVSLQMVAEGDLLVDRMQVEGTNTGSFMGMPPTGKHAVWTFVDIVRFKDGLMVEHWNVGDNLSLMQQLGVMPSVPQG
jgi:predicted ester cyclase